MTIPFWHSMILALTMTLSVPVLAAENANETATAALEERLAAQEARIEALEALVARQAAMLIRLEAALAPEWPSTETASASVEAAPPAPVPQADSPPTAGWTGSHAFINSEGGDYTMEFTGRMHLDYRGFTADTGPESTFVLRRARLGVEGELFESYEYKVEADVADTGSTLLRDGYINLAGADAFQLQFGQFKVPFSQEVLQSSNRVNFAERSSLANLTPDRSPGLMLHGGFLADRVEYALSAQTGRGLLSTSDSGTPEVFGRLRFRPFQGSAAFENFAFGGAYSQGRSEDIPSVRGRTASRSVTFFSPVPVNGKKNRVNAEFDWLYDRFALRGEFIQTNERRDGLGPAGGNLPGVIAKGFSVDTAYVFGGDQQANTAIVPHTTFMEGGLGALQLVLRYENLQIDDSVNPNRSDAYTFGFNWWLSRFIRHQSNFVYEQFQHPERTGAFNGRDTFTYLGRMQLMF